MEPHPILEAAGADARDPAPAGAGSPPGPAERPVAGAGEAQPSVLFPTPERADPADRAAELRRDWQARLKPIDEAERTAVDSIVGTVRRRRLLERVEERVLEALADGRPDPAMPSLGTLARHAGRLEKDRQLVERELLDLRRLRPMPIPRPDLNPERLEWLAGHMRRKAERMAAATAAFLEAAASAPVPVGGEAPATAAPAPAPAPGPTAAPAAPVPAPAPPAPAPVAPAPAAAGPGPAGPVASEPSIAPPSAEGRAAAPAPPTSPPAPAAQPRPGAGPAVAAAPFAAGPQRSPVDPATGGLRPPPRLAEPLAAGAP